eukprot:1487810-Rhodomonas_salina.1
MASERQQRTDRGKETGSRRRDAQRRSETRCQAADWGTSAHLANICHLLGPEGQKVNSKDGSVVRVARVPHAVEHLPAPSPPSVPRSAEASARILEPTCAFCPASM